MPAELIAASLSASWLILAVIVVRAVCRQVPRAMICLLWGLAALRLVCPFSIKCPLSLVPDTGPIVERIVSAAPTEPAPPSALELGQSPAMSLSATEEAGTADTAAPDAQRYGTALWAAGMAALLGYAAASCLCLRRRVAASVRVKGNIWLCDWIDAPFILGIFRPRIYLPSSMDSGQFPYVLAHENAHLSRHDHWWKPLGFALLAVYWFHPLVWAAYILFCRDIELACDEKVIRTMGIWERKTYSQILLACSTSGPMASVCPVAFGGVGVRTRVKSVLRYRKPARRVMIAAAAAGVLLAVCFFTDPLPAAASGGPQTAGIPDPTPASHWLIQTPPSPSPASAAPEPSPTRPTKDQVLAAREKALEGMTQGQIDRLTQVITGQNLWWEGKYLDNVLTRLDDPGDLAWNYFEKMGDIDVGEGICYKDETGLTGDERLALCEKEGITVDEFFEKYGTAEAIFIGDYSKYSVDEIVSMIGDIRDTVQNQDLRTDLAYLANQILWARETHHMVYVSNMFKMLHDMDYYLLRYGPADQPSTDIGYGPVSVVSNYYGMLTVFGAEHGEGFPLN